MAEATPTDMIAPMSDGMLSAVPAANRLTAMAQKATGSAARMTNGSPQLWKFAAISRQTNATAARRPRPIWPNAAFVLAIWPSTRTLLPGERPIWASAAMRWMPAATAARSRSCTLA